ncbi:MAG: folylpolyglutamate synthase/dihydrofolate synthase family protein [Anaerolineae bacterium]
MTWSYEEALDYLYSFINYEVRREVRYAPEVMNLDRPRKLLELLGNPQEAYPIIHITGTKGKGSVGAYCHAALQAAGLRAGLYSSPHLQDFRERFRVNGDMIPRDTLARLVLRMRPAIEAVPELTWFEITTALAFLYFQEEAADVVVLEVGLGGRLDATNVVTPLVSVITSLSYDHTHLLGNTLAEIAFEKAGIIKPGVPVVSAPQLPEAERVLREVAQANGSRLVMVGSDWQVVAGQSTRQGQQFLVGKNGALHKYWTPLIGHHQAINAAVALAALDEVRQAGVPLPETLTPDRKFLANWPGRFEIIDQKPVIVLDAAHNGASAECLRETLAEVFPDNQPRVLVFGASADKDVAGMFEVLLPAFDHLLVVQAVHPRALSTQDLSDLAARSGFTGDIEQIPPVNEALARASETASPEGLIVVTGSLFVVGEARNVLGLPTGRAAYLESLSKKAVRVR